MDSNYTLVNSSSLQLSFSKNSMTNTVLLSEDGIAMYVVSTPDSAVNCTQIKDVYTDQPLMTVRRRDVPFLSDTITFHRTGKSLKLDHWMSSVRLTGGSKANVIETDSGKYYWKTHQVHRFALYHESDLSTPVARMISSGATPGILMEAGTEPIREQILASLLIVEQKMRMKEKSSSINTFSTSSSS